MSQSVTQPSTLISDEYRRMQEELHCNPNYGVASVSYAPLVAEVLTLVRATELLDYGAGKGRLGQTLRQHGQGPLTIHHYDPAIPEWSAPPAPCGVVALIDLIFMRPPVGWAVAGAASVHRAASAAGDAL